MEIASVKGVILAQTGGCLPFNQDISPLFYCDSG